MPIAASIITIEEASDFLNISTTDSDSELTDFIAAASQAWVQKVGPVADSPTYDEWYDGGRPSIVLRHTPVQQIASITEAYTTSLAYTLNAETLDGTGGGDAYGYTVDLNSGIVTRRATGMAVNFATGRRNIRVVYIAGYTTTPADIKHAVKLLVKHMWETQRGGARRTQAGEQEFAPGGAFTWPQRVEEIAAGYRVPGIA